MIEYRRPSHQHTMQSGLAAYHYETTDTQTELTLSPLKPSLSSRRVMFVKFSWSTRFSLIFSKELTSLEIKLLLL